MVTNEDILEKLLIMSPANSLPVLSQLSPAFLLLLATLVTPNQLPYALVELFLLFLVDSTAHLVSLVVVEQNLPQV
jgi:hypothetical protein